MREASEKPILFSGPMVRAILSGSKTQTRRAVKPQPPEWAAHANTLNYLNGEHKIYQHTAVQWVESDRPHPGRALRRWPEEHYQPCPFGLIGDRLWVREKFYCDHVWAGKQGTPEEWLKMTYYGADYLTPSEWANAEEWAEGTPPWRPSIHMPRWASRITLEVTGVRVERVQDISHDDATAEGVLTMSQEEIRDITPPGRTWTRGPAVARFECLWESINGERAPWSSNPWVWVVSFKRVEAKRA